MENIEELKDITTTTASQFAEQLATAALSAFASLPKTGKPQPHEHTAYAAIAITFPPQSHAAACLGIHNNNNQKSNPLIISLATGTKCLPGSKRAADGSALNDCHAEVLARRAFLRWIYDEIQYAAPRTKAAAATTAEAVAASPPSLVLSIKQEESSTSSGKWTVELLEGVQIHMFTSHPPCGDAAIGSSGGGEGDAAGQACSGCEGSSERVGRTGAKPLIKRQKVENNTTQNDQTTTTTASSADWVLPQAHHVESYASAQATGIVRRKPGRGDPTLSVSCSDKIAKWSLLGIQGALLSSVLVAPLFLRSLVVGAPVGVVTSSTISNKKEETDKVEKNTRSPVNVEMTENALKRAFQDRIESLPPPLVQLDTSAVSLNASELDTLGLLAGEVRRVPCGTSITWRAAPSAQWRLKPAKQQWSIGSGSSSNTNTTTMLITEGFSECITGLFGSKAGAARRGADPVPPERQSALCRAALFKRFSQVSRALEMSTSDTITYAEAKNESGAASGYTSRWNEIRKATTPTPSPFEGWIEKPSLGSEFTALL